jgi:hypothetical protein
MPDKWYLNMLAEYDDGTRKSRSGTRVKLAAKPSLAVKFSNNPRVNWVVTYAGSPDGHANYAAAPSFTAAQSGLDNGYFRTNLDLPVVNGRTYTVEARRAGNNARVFQKQYETWQRIYYTVHYMGNGCRDAFNAIKDDLIQMFADANIELKERKVLQCRKNRQNLDQEYTTTGPGLTLPHTWDEADAPLDRAPNHIRMVVTRDLCSKVDGSVEWTMTNATTANADRKIRISSTGQNHSRIVYENDIATFDQARPFTGLTVHAKLAPLDLPDACVAVASTDRQHQALSIALDGDPSLLPVLTRFNSSENIAMSGTLHGRRCEQGWKWRYVNELRATLSSAHTEQAPATQDSAKLWITGGDTVVIDDPRMFLDASSAADTIKVSYEQTQVTLDNNTVTRASEHRLTIALGLGDDILDPADYRFEFKQISKYNFNSMTSGELSCSANGTTRLSLQGDKIAITGTDALTAEFVNLSVPIPVPDTVVTTTSSHHAEIDLTGDPSLGPIATAMQNGLSITFKGDFNGRESLGGYSPTQDRWFIALNTRALPGWDQDIVNRRLKLTICHEIGHSLGLVRDSVQNLNTAAQENNDRWYDDDHGGRGPHCHINAHLVAAGAANGFEDTPSGRSIAGTLTPAGNCASCITRSITSTSAMRFAIAASCTSSVGSAISAARLSLRNPPAATAPARPSASARAGSSRSDRSCA